MNSREFIKKALDTTNGFIMSESAEAQAVNPNVWDYRLKEYEEKVLVVTPLAEYFDFRKPGVDYKVTIDEAPSVASALVETADVSISAFSTRNVTFSPSEYGAGYQLTRKEAVRAFFNVADRMVTKLGYSLAQKKDALAVSTIYNGATTTIYANSKTVATDIASTDTLKYIDITRAMDTIEQLYYTPDTMLINFRQKKQLLDLETVHKANEFGTRTAIQKGLVGELFGLQIFVSHSIPIESNKAKAIIMGSSRTGEKAFGYAVKRDPMIEKEYHARGRYWDIVAHEEYDFKVLHPDAICLLVTYA